MSANIGINIRNARKALHFIPGVSMVRIRSEPPMKALKHQRFRAFSFQIQKKNRAKQSKKGKVKVVNTVVKTPPIFQGGALFTVGGALHRYRAGGSYHAGWT